jgi:hypothetical protein
MKWVVFATAPDQLTAEMWRDLLRQEGMRCELRLGDMSAFLGVAALPVRLVAPEEQAAHARRWLQEHLKAGGDEPEPRGVR